MNTLDYYNENAQEYFNTSLNADMNVVYEKFLKHIGIGKYILDFGCGSGRDSKHFIDNGYKVDAIDGSEELCYLASYYLNQEVKCIKFEEFCEFNKYDGIWACSSLLHIPKNDFKSILIKLRDALKINGILYISLKNGTGEEIKNGRYFNYLTHNEFIDIISDIGLFEEIDFFVTNSSVNKDEDKVWNNFILRKMEV
jgi:2-polyprenyl-3-methyl-5-hydroxy-6-metoxy-1,4-benzoquinol methylase